MTEQTLIDDLRANVLTGSLSESQLADLAAVGEEIVFAAGDELFREGDQADYLWILLDGQVEVVRRSANEAAVLFTMTSPGQWAGGWRAWEDASQKGGPRPLHPMQHPSFGLIGYAASAGRLFRVPSEALSRLADEWFPFAKHLIMGMYQNAWRTEAIFRKRGSLVALGALAAGLAHEINNPAAAAMRAVDSLRRTVDELLDDLARYSLSAEQRTTLDHLRRELIGRPPPEDGTIATMDREDAVINWLERRGIPQAWQIGSDFTLAGADQQWLDQVETAMGGDGLEPGLHWTSTAITAAALLSTLADTTSRISDLVGAVKSYAEMDPSSLQRIDVHSGLESALRTLADKLERVDVHRAFATNVPRIDAYAVELNRVWINLIENSVDAMDGQGTLQLATRVDGDAVVVDVTDSGHGMSPEVETRAFEPFFTTKDVGKAAGLGLDLARRIVVEYHGGEITFDSGPGGTTAHVRLPVAR